MKLSAQEITALSEDTGIFLVFDPSHLLSDNQTLSLPNQPTKTRQGKWEQQFQQFASRLEVIDINPPQLQDVNELLRGRGLLAELAKAAKQTPKTNFLRVEIPLKRAFPYSPWKNQEFSLLKNIAKALKAA